MDDVIMALREAEEHTQPPGAFDLDDAMRRGRRRTRRRRASMAGAGVALAAAVGTGLVFGVADWPFTARPAPPADMSPDGTPVPEEVLEPTVDQPGELMALFTERQRPRDELPDEVKAVANVDESTTRALGEFRDTRFWAALMDDAPGNPPARDLNFPVVCTVVVVAGEWQTTGCGGWASSERPGPSIFAGAAAGTAQLIPDGYEPSPDQLDEWTFVAPNLAITDVRPDCPPLTPSALPDGSSPGRASLGSRQLPDGSEAVLFTWGTPESQVTQLIGEDPPRRRDPEGEPLTVRGAEARLYAVSPGTFAVAFELDGCQYALDIGPGLTEEQARAYAASF